VEVTIGTYRSSKGGSVALRGLGSVASRGSFVSSCLVSAVRDIYLV
jgi:hypothetical protein